jgi:hypothetical protein
MLFWATDEWRDERVISRYRRREDQSSAHGRRALGLLGVLALLVAVLSNANVVGTYVSAHGHITEVAEVDILRALAIEREHLLALGNL